jgi:putative hemolysin
VWCIELTIVIAMVLVNAVFAGYEIALASVSLARLHDLTRSNRSAAAAALRMKQNMEGSLAVVQLGMALVGAIAAATSGAWASEWIAPALQRLGLAAPAAAVAAIALVVVPLTGLTILCGELLPKLFALRNKEWVCLRLSPLMRWFALLTRPVVWLLERSAITVMNWSERHWKPGGGSAKSEAAELQELRAIAALARTARLIGAREENIILGAARLSSRPIREIMLPAEHICTLNVNDSIANCLVAAHLDMHTRYPVTERTGDLQAIIGYVNFKDIVAHLRLAPHEPSLRGVVRAIPNLSADAAIASGLESLLREHLHIALVRDGSGKVLGMVTLEDILEELIGDIQDEYDLLPGHALASGAGWVVGGGIGLARLRELTGIDPSGLAAGGAQSLSAWIAGRLGRPVRGGDVVEGSGLRVAVRKVRRGQVLEAQVSRLLPTEAGSTRGPKPPLPAP